MKRELETCLRSCITLTLLELSVSLAISHLKVMRENSCIQIMMRAKFLIELKAKDHLELTHLHAFRAQALINQVDDQINK